MHDFSIILLQNIHAHKKFKIFVINLSQLDSAMISVCIPMKQHLASPWGRGNYGNCATGQPRVSGVTTYLSLRPFYRVVSGWDNRSSSCARDSARPPRDANVSNISSGYDVYLAKGTRDATSKLSLPVSSQRLGHGKSSGSYMTLQCSMPPHSKGDAPYVTAIHQTYSQTW